MARLRYRLVDVFATTTFTGNPLCVVVDECPPDLMPRIARDVNVSETTFPTAVGVPEDPGPVALVAREVWRTAAHVAVLMGAEVGRPSRIDVEIADELWVGGAVVMSAEGQFYT